jgi:alkylation response protein AidB-like acyl-CoA dehydrogenase
MQVYEAPVRDMRFVLDELWVDDGFGELPALAEFDSDLTNAILEEAARFSREVLLPLNRTGDEEGCVLENGVVRTPAGFKEAYKQFTESGWSALAADPEWGGQGLPERVNKLVEEMTCSTNLSFGLYPGLTHGGSLALEAHGTEDLKQRYLPKMTSGEWSGTMCLTESHCGTDLGLLRTKAVPQDDGSYKISGAKIFISAGDHDLTDNIIHLVLARLPDAPKGVKGISLFLVPKFLPNDDGSIGPSNGVQCTALEHKMGIKASATCQMMLDGAIGTLVGQPHKGLAAMFVMMNAARLGVGNQSLGLTEVAYQNAVAYAKDRLQMRSLSGPKAPELAADPIIVHPDVRKMLLTARAYAEGARAMLVYTTLQLDVMLATDDDDERQEMDDLVALLTPVIKAFITDNAWIATSHCQQVFGGHGYIHEWGMEQFVRDARINMIYEGTNTIQSLDLLGRKVLGDNGAKLKKFGKQIAAFVEDEGTNEAMQEFINPLADLGDKLTKLTTELGMKAFGNADEVGAAAVDYLRVMGHLCFAYFWARMAKVALEKQADPATAGDAFYTAKLHTARFYFAKLLPETASLIRTARAGLAPLMAMDEALF